MSSNLTQEYLKKNFVVEAEINIVHDKDEIYSRNKKKLTKNSKTFTGFQPTPPQKSPNSREIRQKEVKSTSRDFRHYVFC